MTKKERAQVVELLRCAADLVLETKVALLSADLDLEPDAGVWEAAADALQTVRNGVYLGDDERRRACFLEAAQRVEEGSYP